jgi:plastocyanin
MINFKKSAPLLACTAAAVLLAAVLLPSAAILTPNSAYAFHTFGGTYVVNIIPGAAQKESLYHYYPPKIAVPKHTEVAWFENDPEQPHTVTSGSPGSQDSGQLFNSGVMSYLYFFQYEFDKAGDYSYYCQIHPWRTGLVHVSDQSMLGKNFEFSTGTGSTWSLSEFDRNLLKFEPTTVSLEETTPASYYFTMANSDTKQTVYSRYFPSTNNLQVELISGSSYNQTTTFGPDRASTIHSHPGAFHVQGNFAPGNYTISVVLYSVNGKLSDPLPLDQFQFKVVQ